MATPKPISFAVLRIRAPVANCSRMRSTTSALTGRRPRRFPYALIRALDIFGRAVDPAWTREEIKQTPHPNRQMNTSPTSLLHASRVKRLISFSNLARATARAWGSRSLLT
jgi:hypothetical protein